MKHELLLWASKDEYPHFLYKRIEQIIHFLVNYPFKFWFFFSSNTGSLAVSWNEELKVVTGGGSRWQTPACASSGMWCGWSTLNLLSKFSFISSSANLILTLHIPAVFHHLYHRPSASFCYLFSHLRERERWMSSSWLPTEHWFSTQQTERKQVHSITD